MAVVMVVAAVAVLQVEVIQVPLRRTRRELVVIRERVIAQLFEEPLQASIAREWPRHGIRFMAHRSAIGLHWARIGSRRLSTRQFIIRRQTRRWVARTDCPQRTRIPPGEMPTA